MMAEPYRLGGRRLRALAVMLLLYLICSGHNGGCHPDDGELLPSPVHALGVVLERPDGTLDVRLSLVSNALLPHELVTAAAPKLHIPGGDVLPLDEVAPGRYRLAPEDAAELRYESDDYLLSFSIEADEAHAKHVIAGDFVIAMHGPAGVPVVQLAEPTEQPSGEQPQAGELASVVSWQPEAMAALIELYDDSGELLVSNLLSDLDEAELPTWSALQPGGSAELPLPSMPLPSNGLPAAEPHSVRVCTVEVARFGAAASQPEAAHLDSATPYAQPQHLSGSSAGQLGSSSGMLVGRCVELSLSPAAAL